jgi:polysaccharide pyruvyl transferase WcaK-like protein
MYSSVTKYPNATSPRCFALFLALVSQLDAAVSVQAAALESDSIIDPQNESPSNAYEVTLDAVGAGFHPQASLEGRASLRVIRDFSPGNPLNHPDPTVIDTAEVDFRFSYSGAVATASSSFQISNNPSYQTSWGSSVSLKGISNSPSPLILRVDAGTWDGGAGIFTPATVEGLGFTLSGPFGRLLDDAATVTYHAADDSVLSTQRIATMSHLAAYTGYNGTVSHVKVTLQGDGSSGIPIVGLDDLAFTIIPASATVAKRFAVDLFELSHTARTIRLGWQSEIGKTYTIERSTDLTDWSPVVTHAASQGARTIRKFDEDAVPAAAFYRVKEGPAQVAPRPEILLRSSWQTVNIGDIAHTPGMLQLLQNAHPTAKLTLWASDTSRGVGDLLRAEFPGLEIVYGNVSNSGVASNPNLQNAWNRADILIHGSGPYLVAESSIEAWRQATNKPYGIGGVSQVEPGNATMTLLNQAAFVFLRDPVSLSLVQGAGATSPVIGFGPDATFALGLRDDALAQSYLQATGLLGTSFLCVIPRLRWTPYWEINNTTPTATEELRIIENNTWKEIDHAKLRETIIRWVRETGNPVLCCPEMSYAVDLIPELLIDPLPADVKPHVVWRDSYWLTAEAAGVYARASAILSLEMHSPIIAIANGVPAIYVRQPTDTSKGYMWPHIGLNHWFFEVDTATGAGIADAVMAIHQNPAAARALVRSASANLHAAQTQMMEAVGNALGTSR